MDEVWFPFVFIHNQTAPSFNWKISNTSDRLHSQIQMRMKSSVHKYCCSHSRWRYIVLVVCHSLLSSQEIGKYRGWSSSKSKSWSCNDRKEFWQRSWPSWRTKKCFPLKPLQWNLRMNFTFVMWSPTVRIGKTCLVFCRWLTQFGIWYELQALWDAKKKFGCCTAES